MITYILIAILIVCFILLFCLSRQKIKLVRIQQDYEKEKKRNEDLTKQIQNIEKTISKLKEIKGRKKPEGKASPNNSADRLNRLNKLSEPSEQN